MLNFDTETIKINEEIHSYDNVYYFLCHISFGYAQKETQSYRGEFEYRVRQHAPYGLFWQVPRLCSRAKQ